MGKTLSGVERVLAGIVLFYGAAAFCLPVQVLEDVAYPWWATKITIGNVALHELLFLVWLALYGWSFVLRRLLNGGMPTRQAAVWLIVLAVWCGLVSMLAPLPLQDLGRTLRLLLNVALLLAVVRWTRQSNNFPLEMLVWGFFIGTVLNLIISFQNPLIVNEVMRLSGQNTPGVAMGVAMHLTAWLFFRTSRRSVRALSVAAALICGFGCGISYSRIGWFCGALGLLAWVYMLFVARPAELEERLHLRKIRRIWVPLLAVGLVALLTTPLAREDLQWIYILVEQKLNTEGGGDEGRAAYAQGVAEIVTKHPLGVGYSGFFDAMTATTAYHSGKALEEESEEEANPHAAFLWYASAGGIPGAVMAFGVFVMLLNSLRFGLRSAMGRPGLMLFALVALAFLLIGMTVPYLLNSIILIVPTAIAAGWGWSRRVALVDKRSAGVSETR